jgi:hypothetical protein
MTMCPQRRERTKKKKHGIGAFKGPHQKAIAKDAVLVQQVAQTIQSAGQEFGFSRRAHLGRPLRSLRGTYLLPG